MCLPSHQKKNSKHSLHVRAYECSSALEVGKQQQAALEKLFDETLNAASKAAFRRNAKLNFVAKQLIIRNL